MEQSELEVARRGRVATEKKLLADLAGANTAAVAHHRHFIAMRYLHRHLQPKLSNVCLSPRMVVTLTNHTTPALHAAPASYNSGSFSAAVGAV